MSAPDGIGAAVNGLIADRNRIADERDALQVRLSVIEAAAETIGPWLSAAEEDPSVCREMKMAIADWMYAIHPPENEHAEAALAYLREQLAKPDNGL